MKTDLNQTATVTPTAVRKGSFVSTGTHTPLRADGELVASGADLSSADARTFRDLKKNNLYVDVLRDGVVAQTIQVLANLRATLEAHGSSLDRLVHLRVFLHDMVDEPFVLQTLETLLGHLPSGQIVEARNAGSDPAVRVHADAFALDASSNHSLRHVPAPKAGLICAPFPIATQAGPYIFTSCLAASPQPGVAAGYADLEPEERAIVDGLAPMPDRQRAFILQQAAMWGHGRKLMREWGGSLQDVVHHFAWLGIDMRQLGNGSITRMVSSLAGQYCLTCFPVSRLRGTHSLIEGKFIALDPSSGVRKDVRLPMNPLSNSYFNAIRAGELLFAAGEVPIDLERGRLVHRASRYPGRMELEHGLVQADRRAFVEAAYVYEQIGASLQAYGLTWEHVMNQTLYLCDASDWGQVMLACADAFGAHWRTSTTSVPILGASPFADNRLEVEFTASFPAEAR